MGIEAVWEKLGNLDWALTHIRTFKKSFKFYNLTVRNGGQSCASS